MDLKKFYLSIILLFQWTDGFPWQQDMPICTSHNKLCDVSFEIKSDRKGPNSPSPPFPSSIPMCRCPGSKPCPNGRRDPATVSYDEMTSPGLYVKTKLSFCDATSVPKRSCKKGELAVTLRGFGPVITDVVGRVQCKCRGPVVLKKAFPDGMLSVRQYSCGRKVCRINSSTRQVCERVTPAAYGGGKISEIPCQCPEGFYCNINALGLTDSSSPTEFYCEPVQQWK